MKKWRVFLSDKSKRKDGIEEIQKLEELQAINYARELSGLYRSEKEKRQQLEIANRELNLANEELSFLRSKLEQENTYLREEVQDELAYGEIIGESPRLQEVLTQILQVSRADAPVLIEGETGTGKELVARAIHEKSPRKNHPLIKVNCAAVPHELFESEFFGHLRGAFTGAMKDRMGRFQLADGGTLFLDEVSEIPLELQSKLLRVLQEGSFERVGDDKTRTVDVRIIAATNRNLQKEMQEGRFRQDLYFRLGVVPIFVPPLRERREDIPLLATEFIERFARKSNAVRKPLTLENTQKLQAYDWPGNIRELQNVLERSMIISSEESLEINLEPIRSAFTNAIPKDIFSEEKIKMQEKENLISALNKANGKVYGPGGAAEILGLQPATLAYRIKKLGIQK
ncbi:MAG: sigma 54-interacting transcriptional regulator [Nitrospina sp.]|nr:sigma 54-interacting transcriptional regulator [Nitrospina sp.]MBT6716269.1 sigma 54-interacting transcriptional regulator [Nitrospina sp.]